MLQDLALREGVEIRHDANVVCGDQEGPSVTLDTGETIRGDIVVLADGCSSSLRSTMTKNPQDPRPGSGVKPTSRVLFITFTVNINFLKDDESFIGVLQPNHVRFLPS
jgi:2-polyprenyl-6-methoxyphenol hydroxylase-like FAD-dependent oxidoreductase